MMKKMADSTRRALEYAAAPEREVVQQITGRSGAVDGVDEAQHDATIDAAGAGFAAVLLRGNTLVTGGAFQLAVTQFSFAHVSRLQHTGPHAVH